MLIGAMVTVVVLAFQWAGGATLQHLLQSAGFAAFTLVLAWGVAELLLALRTPESDASAVVMNVGKVAIGVLGFGVLTFAGLWLSGMAFLAFNKTDPRKAHWDSTVRYWSQYSDDPAQKKKLVISLALSFGLAYIAVPGAIATAARTSRPTYGNARFATKPEIRRTGLMKGEGFLIGKIDDEYITLPGQQFALVAAPPRSGKDVAIVTPNLFHHPGSAICFDIKGEQRDRTSGFRARSGQEVHVFAPFDTSACTARWNPLGAIRTDAHLRVKDILKRGQVIYPNDSNKVTDSGNFFNDQARNLFLALALYLLETPERPRTIGEMLRIVGGDGKPVRETVTHLINQREFSEKPLSYDCIAAFGRFLANTAENTLTGIVGTFLAPLTPFADPVTDAATSASDFDLGDVRKKPMTIYVVLPFDELEPARLLLNLFVTEMVSLNVRELPSQNKELKYVCDVYLNEFTAAGRIDVIARGIGFMPAYNMRLMIIIQSVAQLEAVYGREMARAITTACACHVVFAPSEQADAEAYSKRLGTYTERKVSKGQSTSSGHHSSTSRSLNESEHARPLLLPQEVKEIGIDDQIIFLENHLPIRCKKARFFEDPIMSSRVLDPVVVEPIDLQLHLARAATLIRPVTHQDGDTKDMPMEKIAIHLEDMPPPPEITPDTPDKVVDDWMGGFFERMIQPEPEPKVAPVVEPPKKPRAEARSGEGIGVDITVGKDGKVSLVAKPVIRKRRQKDEGAANPAEEDAPRPPTVTSTADQDIKVEPNGVIEVVPKKPEAAKAASRKRRQKTEGEANNAQADTPRSSSVTGPDGQRLQVDADGVIEMAPTQPGAKDGKAALPKDEPDDLWHDLDLGVLESESNRPAPGMGQERA
jgi:type IV secretion system protein VirD4